MTTPVRVEVWWVQLDLSRDPEPQAFAFLPPEERDRALRLPSRWRMREFAGTRHALRRVLAERIGCHPSRVPLHAEAAGRPVLESDVFGLSLSHASAVTAIALAHGSAVGIDIERADAIDLTSDRMASVTAVMNRSISSECRGSLSLGRRWLRAEASKKLHGAGWALEIDPAGAGVAPTQYHDLKGRSGFMGVVATSTDAIVTEHLAAW